MPESSRRREKRRKPDRGRKKLSKRTVLALIDRFLDVSEQSESDSDTSSSDYDSDAENKRPTRYHAHRRHRDERPPSPKRARHRDHRDPDESATSRDVSAKPAWAQPGPIKALGQDIALVVRDAAPSLLSDEAVMRKLEVGMAKVIAKFAMTHGIGDNTVVLLDHNDAEDDEQLSTSDLEDELSPQVSRHISRVAQPLENLGPEPGVWDAPPLPGGQHRQSAQKASDKARWAAPELPRKQEQNRRRASETRPSAEASSSAKRKGRHSLPNGASRPPIESTPIRRMASSARPQSALDIRPSTRVRWKERSARPPAYASDIRMENSESAEEYNEDASIDVDHNVPIEMDSDLAGEMQAEEEDRDETDEQDDQSAAQWGLDNDDSIIAWAEEGLSWDEMAARLPAYTAGFIKQQYVQLYESGALEGTAAPPPDSRTATGRGGSRTWGTWSEDDKKRIASMALEQGMNPQMIHQDPYFAGRTLSSIKNIVVRVRRHGVTAGNTGKPPGRRKADWNAQDEETE